MTSVGPMAEAEDRVLSSAALTRILSHVYLCNPDANLDDLLEPVDARRSIAAAEAIKGRAEALLSKFRAFNTTKKKTHPRHFGPNKKKLCHTYDTSMTIIVTKPGIIIDVVGSYFYDKKS